MNLVAPDCHVERFVKSGIMPRYDNDKESLLKILTGVKSACLSTDMWTSNATDTYMTLTEHHITNDWEMESNVCMTHAMPEKQTGGESH